MIRNQSNWSGPFDCVEHFWCQTRLHGVESPVLEGCSSLPFNFDKFDNSVISTFLGSEKNVMKKGK